MKTNSMIALRYLELIEALRRLSNKVRFVVFEMEGKTRECCIAAAVIHFSGKGGENAFMRPVLRE